ncbi:conserved hypothetical protein [Candidatus Sulfopaludibacter sp. SbA6]|nr:conserved hypothetical protein [Candidatus Sulfopaludibacter sp. SbA6]
MAGDLSDTLKFLAAALDQLGIPYLIGGSMASSARGIARATRDIDIVADIRLDQADRFAAALGPNWYVEPDQIRQALRAGRAFNVIYIPKSQKVDIFPAAGEFQAAQLERASKLPLTFLGIDAEYPVASAEDILLAKLQWYRAGGEISDRQWSDITGILATNPAIDLDYTRSWAARLRVEDLLDKALAEVASEQN